NLLLPGHGLKPRLESRQSAIQPRLHSGQRSRGNPSNLIQRQLFVKAQNQHFTMQRVKRQKQSGDKLAVLVSLIKVERIRTIAGDLKSPLILGVLAQL